MFLDFIPALFNQLALFVIGLQSWQQVGALAAIGAIPFIESYFGSLLGVISGVSPYIAVPAAVLGNAACTFLLIALANRGRTALRRNGSGPKVNAKVARYFNRFGVPGVTLLGPMVLASQITAPTLVALGANARTVYLWAGISVAIWGVVFGFFGTGLAALLA